MGDWYVGEIRLFTTKYAPEGWHLCDGTLLSPQTYSALFSIIRTFYGGNGTTTFALPNLGGRVVVGQALNDPTHTYSAVGKTGGAETVALTSANIPPHPHPFNVLKETGAFPLPTGNFFATAPNSGTTVENLYAAPVTNQQIPLNVGTITNLTAGTAHANMQPYLALNFCIAIKGTYPPRP